MQKQTLFKFNKTKDTASITSAELGLSDISTTKIRFSRPKLMGILNITDDSFSDGGKYIETEKAINKALNMITEGADIIDIGGESSRPGANPISTKTEIKRVIPIIKEIRKINSIQISVDTYKSEVAENALKSGADIINDIFSLRHDSNMINILKDYPISKIVLMHMQGTPETMQNNPFYNDVIEDIIDFFKERIDYCLDNGISEDRIIIDPGIGFGKTFSHNLEIMKNIDKFKFFGLPILIGTSKKSFIGSIMRGSQSEVAPMDRLSGTLASSAVAIFNGANILRVHDVKEHFEFINSLEWLL